jgi:hypothetical protein
VQSFTIVCQRLEGQMSAPMRVLGLIVLVGVTVK